MKLIEINKCKTEKYFGSTENMICKMDFHDCKPYIHAYNIVIKFKKSQMSRNNDLYLFYCFTVKSHFTLILSNVHSEFAFKWVQNYRSQERNVLYWGEKYKIDYRQKIAHWTTIATCDCIYHTIQTDYIRTKWKGTQQQ